MAHLLLLAAGVAVDGVSFVDDDVSFVAFVVAVVVVVFGASESELSPELVPELSLKMLFILDLSTAVEPDVGVDAANDLDVAFDDDVAVIDNSESFRKLDL